MKRCVPLVFLVVFAAAALFFNGFFIEKSAAISTASFNPERIVDDGVFYNNNSMSVAQIQLFLNSKMPNCDTWGTQTYSGSTTRAQYGASRGFPAPYTCLKDYYENPTTRANNLKGSPVPSGAMSAAQIIASAANSYNINPQVLIVLLQKEQGLVTDTWPFPTQYQAATGYGCPDTAPCDTAYYGFYNQVTQAAKQFRNYANYPNSFNYVPGAGNFVLYNPNASCSGAYLNIRNQATASLYNYTPYQPNQAALNAGYGTGDSCSAYGNRNFWLYFNDWFGSTLFPQPYGGSLLYQSSTGKMFLTTGSLRYYIPSWSMLVNYGLDTFPAQPVSDATILQYTDGGNLTNLVYNSEGVFLVNNKTMYHVSPAMCTAWALSCYDSTAVLALGSAFQTGYLNKAGELPELSSAGGIIFKMEQGKKLPVANPKTLSDLGLVASPVLVTSDTNSGYPLGRLLMTTPGVIQFSQTGALYYFDGASYFQVPNMASYFDWNLTSAPQLSVPASEYATTPPTSTILGSFVNSGGASYVIDQGRRLSVPVELQVTWPADMFTVNLPQALLNSLPNYVMSKNIYSSAGIFVLSGGTRHHVKSLADLSGLGITNANMTALRADKILLVPSGPDALPDGKLVQTANDTRIYVVNNRKLLYIPSPAVFNAFGYDWGAIQSYANTTTLAPDYPVDSNTLGPSINAAGDALVMTTSGLYRIPSNFVNDYGVKTAALTKVSDLAVKRTNIPMLQRFFYNSDDGRIYYASGQAIHYVSSLVSYAAYGGLGATPAVVTTQTLALFTVGQPI